MLGIFANDASITRFDGAVLLEQVEHCLLEGRRMFSLDAMATIPPNAQVLLATEE